MCYLLTYKHVAFFCVMCLLIEYSVRMKEFTQSICNQRIACARDWPHNVFVFWDYRFFSSCCFVQPLFLLFLNLTKSKQTVRSAQHDTLISNVFSCLHDFISVSVRDCARKIKRKIDAGGFPAYINHNVCMYVFDGFFFSLKIRLF